MNLGDVNFNKKNIKVKNYVRKGKLVKSYNKKIDIKSALLGAGGGLLGAGAIGSAFLLGRGKGLKQATKLVVGMKDDIVNEVKKQSSKNTDEIVNKVIDRLPKQEKVDSESIIRAVEDRVTRNNKDLLSILDNKLSQVSVGNNSGNNTISNITKKDISITQTQLPKRKPNIPKKLDEILESVSDSSLEKSIRLRTNELNKYAKTQQELGFASRLKVEQDRLKEAVDTLNRVEKDPKSIEAQIRAAKRDVEERIRLTNEPRKYFGLPDIDLKKLNEYDFNYVRDKDYEKKLAGVIDRKKEILTKYEKELLKRQEARRPKVEDTREDITNRIQDLLEDFSYSTKSIINFRSPICLGDIIYV